MKTGAYHRMAESESEHWYYAARGRAIETLIQQHVLPNCPRPEIVDVGCGTGGTTARLARFGKVLGIEPSPVAIELVKRRFSSLDVIQGTIGDLSTLIPDRSYDLVTVLGVLCHRGVSDPLAALDCMAAKLRDGGWILWGDCVYPCLTRPHDEFVEAGRRFYPKQMHDLLRISGFEIVFSSHFLGWGFPVALGLATWHRILNFHGRSKTSDAREAIDDRPLSSFLNYALSQLTYWEWSCGLVGFKAPLGVSRLVLGRKITRTEVPAARVQPRIAREPPASDALEVS